MKIFVGLIAEGSTDYRFFKPVAESTLLHVAFDCKGQIDIEVLEIFCDKGSSFTDYVINACKEAQDIGATFLIVHADADSKSKFRTYNDKIKPAQKLLANENDLTHCKNIIPLVPIYETESWMMADTTALLRFLGTSINPVKLGIISNPETLSDPKKVIEEAILSIREEMPKKSRKNLDISAAYSFVGNALQVDSLRKLDSFLDFERNIRSEFIKLNLLSE